MPDYYFEIEQRAVGPGQHSWFAVETGCGDVVPLPRGGSDASGENLVGQYPELSVYLRQKHRIDVPLVYVSQLDRLQINPDGSSLWTFCRRQAEVVVRDIPRVVVSVTVSQMADYDV